MNPRGFTLIEVLAALAILAIAIGAWSLRLATSTELARTALHQSLLLTLAANEIERAAQSPLVQQEQQKQRDLPDGGSYRVRIWSEKTLLEGFLRENVEVSIEGEPPFALFLYRSTP